MSEAVILCGHGTVGRLDDLESFVTNIRRGRPPAPALVSELKRRYEAIGGRSPLLEISERLAEKLSERLNLPVRLATRMWRPFPKDVLRELARSGVRRVTVVPLAQFSGHVYGEAVAEAARHLREEGGPEFQVRALPNWGLHPLLVSAFRARLDQALDRAPASTVVLFTAHSLPKSLIDAGDPYEVDYREAVSRIVRGISVPHRVAFQSQGLAGAGERPIPWLGPDVRSSMEEIKKSGGKHVLFAPIGFLADHVEILYDLDVEARTWAEGLGLGTTRTESLNDSNDLVATMADLVLKQT